MNAFHRRTGQIQGRRFWQDHIEGLAKSGSSRSAYCRRHQLSYHALTYWLRKQSQPVAESTLSLVEVPLHLPVPILPSSAPIRLRVGGEYLIELEADFDEATLDKLIGILEHRR
jgi:hypothetical protein